MVILDTELYGNTDTRLLKAFLYGQVHSDYKLYKDLDSGNIAIGFENAEDATAFKLKSLDRIFNQEFSRQDDPFGIGSITPPYAPNAHLGTTATARKTKG